MLFIKQKVIKALNDSGVSYTDDKLNQIEFFNKEKNNENF